MIWSLSQIVKPSTPPTNQSVKSLMRRVSSGPLMYFSTGRVADVGELGEFSC